MLLQSSKPIAPFLNARLRRILVPALALLCLCGLGRAAEANTLNVPALAYPTVQAAINAAQDGDTVLIADGTYTGPGNVDVDFDGKNITVTSQDGPAHTVIDCQGTAANNHRGFILHQGETRAVISGLTIQNGFESGATNNGRNISNSGGDIYNSGVGVTIEDCIIKNGSAYVGGGIFNDNEGSGAIRVTGCTLTGNSASDTNYGGLGGAIYNNDASSGTITVVNCTITGNSAVGGNYSGSNGGGILNDNYGSGAVMTINCIISGNSANGGFGGGIRNDISTNATSANSRTITVMDCTLENNTASFGGAVYDYGEPGGVIGLAGCTLKDNTAVSSGVGGGGGGVYNTGGVVSVTNCVLTGNAVSGGGAGGGIDIYTSKDTVTNCTLTGNTGGGVQNYDGSSGNAPTYLINDIVYGDTLDNVNTSEVGGISSASYCDVQGGYPGTGNIDSDPLFVSSASPYDLHLQPGSPCLGAGTANGAPATDIDGVVRPNPPSIGAYEAVPRAATSTTLTSSLNPSVAGQSVTFTAVVTGSGGTPTGIVTFTVDGTAQAPVTIDGSGSATLTTSALSVGQHTVMAAYGGDTTFAPSNPASPLTQTVSQDSTTTGLTSSLNPSAAGQSVTFTATVTGSAPTGTITFLDGRTTLGTGALNGSGVATFTTSTLALGSHSITAVYGGDANNTGSTSALVTQVVLAATNVSVVNAVGSAGQTITLSATLKTSAGAALSGKTLTFSIDGTAVGTALTNSGGMATKSYVVPLTLSVGSHTLTAAFAGDSGNAASSGTGTLTVTKANTALTVSPVSGTPGQTVTLKATLKRVTGGAGLAGETITFTVDGAAVGTAVTNSAGLASLPYVIPAGDVIGSSHPVSATFAGDGGTNGSTGSANLTVSKFTTTLTVATLTGVPGQTVTLSATLKIGVSGLGGKTVTFTVDGTAVGTAVTNSSGIAALPYAIPTGATIGSHPTAATFAGDGSDSASTGKGTLTVKNATALSVANASGAHGTTVTLSAILTAGGAAASGKTVTFKVDGKVVGTAVTDGTGTASVSYAVPSTAKVGSHAVSASFAGDAGDNAATGAGTLTTT